MDPYGAVVFAAPIYDPERYGVIEFDDTMQAVSIKEQPLAPKSNYEMSGLF